VCDLTPYFDLSQPTISHDPKGAARDRRDDGLAPAGIGSGRVLSSACRLDVGDEALHCGAEGGQRLPGGAQRRG
jgi:hypothetical protein